MRLLSCLIHLLLAVCSAGAVAVPRTSAACAFACPASDRTNHALANTVRKGGMMECYYGQNGICAYNLNAGKVKKSKSTNTNCRPNAIASCARKQRTKTKTAKKQQAQVAPILIQRAATPTMEVDDMEEDNVRRGHEDV
ncbi:hypothetical protein DACRYDRAFT_18247 [Dacryopinax primogenitus]|uniref:Secreted protein n=1 Tax=Dacryopinax primogenitus (strain DJM 731) TaxID=1858805 RepID=M5FSL4_DACPD|nr:uncharacterized protein DACRYDRAFT_18247 [Dacryopinax primogenitus]EJT98179.1 hypothetical protein DACRYDRAFT_18247 [Dacryopinax primogenitus]